MNDKFDRIEEVAFNSVIEWSDMDLVQQVDLLNQKPPEQLTEDETRFLEDKQTQERYKEVKGDLSRAKDTRKLVVTAMRDELSEPEEHRFTCERGVHDPSEPNNTFYTIKGKSGQVVQVRQSDLEYIKDSSPDCPKKIRIMRELGVDCKYCNVESVVNLEKIWDKLPTEAREKISGGDPNMPSYLNEEQLGVVREYMPEGCATNKHRLQKEVDPRQRPSLADMPQSDKECELDPKQKL